MAELIIVPVTTASSAPPVEQPSIYLTVDDFFNRSDQRLMSQLSNDNNSRVLLQNTVQQMIYDAAGELEGSLNGRYSLPLAVVPPQIKKWMAIKVTEALFRRRNDKPATLKDDLAWCDTFMEKVENGVIILQGSQPAYAPLVAGPGCSVFPTPPPFGMGRGCCDGQNEQVIPLP